MDFERKQNVKSMIQCGFLINTQNLYYAFRETILELYQSSIIFFSF